MVEFWQKEKGQRSLFLQIILMFSTFLADRVVAPSCSREQKRALCSRRPSIRKLKTYI